MDFLKKITTKTILIIPNNIKEKLLNFIEENNILINIKIMSFNELKKGLFFDYNEETVYLIMKKYNIDYEIAEEYIKNLYYINENNYDDEKLNFLLEIKNYLIAENKLMYDKLFINLLNGFDQIIIYGFDYINKYNNYLLNIASKYIKINLINKINKDYKHSVKEFNNIEDEIIFVAESIFKLIESKVSLNKIYLTNYSNEYDFTIKRIFNMYKIPYFIKNNTSLYNTSIGNYFINNIESDINKTLNKVKRNFDLNNENNKEIYDKIINVLNNYYWTDNKLEIIDMITENFKKKIVSSYHYEKEICFTNLLDNIFNDDEYVFLIGFNSNTPRLRKDEDYISDKIKPDYLDTSLLYNKEVKIATYNAIKNIKNLVITYKLNTSFDSYLPSSLIDNNYLYKEKGEISFSHYSNEINKHLLTKKIDEFIKYNTKDNNLNILYSNYKTDYNTYNNQFNGIKNDTLINSIDDKLNFSYSNISSYYECPFKFYVSNILHINEFKTNFAQYIGSLFHYVLEKCLDKDNDINLVYEEYIENNKFEFSNKDKFFINCLKDELYFTINTIKKQYTYSQHKTELREQRIEINIDKPFKTKIKGFIDKLLICDNNVVIVDYKTGNTYIDRKYFEYGLYLQLPIYLYLVKNFNNDYNVVGIYLQHILNNKLTFKSNKDMNKLKVDELMLDGITLENEKYIKLFDNSYEKSEVIKKLKIKKDGNFANENIMITEDDQNKLYLLIENLILDCINNVNNGYFDIYPIKIGKDIDGCKFCEYKDICFRKTTNYNYKNEIIDNEGSDDNE